MPSNAGLPIKLLNDIYVSQLGFLVLRAKFRNLPMLFNETLNELLNTNFVFKKDTLLDS